MATGYELPADTKLIPDSRAGYRVEYRGRAIGRVERLGSGRRSSWRFTSGATGCGEEITRARAVEAVVSIALREGR